MAQKVKSKFRQKKHSVSYLNVVRRMVSRIYSFAEGLFRPRLGIRRKIKKGTIKIPVRMYQLNNLVKKWYKRPELMITEGQFEEIFFSSAVDEKKISGVIYRPHPESKKWVVASHWFGGQKYFALTHAIAFYKMGYNVLAYDFRGHGQSEKDSTTMGAKEVWDTMGAVSYLTEHEKPEHIALYGISMGAFCSSYLSVYDPEFAKKNKIKFAICDSAFESIASLFYHIRNKYIRVISKKRTKQWVVWILQHHNDAERKNNIDFFATGVINKIDLEKKIPAYPIFFMHAENDKVTNPIDDYRTFKARLPYIKGDEVWTFRFGQHALMIKQHFKDVVKRMGKYIAKMDGTDDLYRNMAEELKLEVTTKRDKKENDLI